MEAWLLDAYRKSNEIILWVKTKEGNRRVVRPFSTSIYIDTSADLKEIRHFTVERITYLREKKQVYEVPVPDLSRYESFVHQVEVRTRYKIPLYNADIPPEQQFLHLNDLRPGVEMTEDRISTVASTIPLTQCTIQVLAKNRLITAININDTHICGDEEDVLKKFVDAFKKTDPDVIAMQYAFSLLPLLVERLEHYNLDCPFHRWDPMPIRYKGGKSFFSYGQVRYKDFAIRLRGRFLIDTSSVVGNECDVEGILELCRLTGALFQQVASRSFGAVFQHSLIRLMLQKGYLIPYKEKPVDLPVTMFDMLKGDRAGHTFDPKLGFHKDVAEIDFSSMFPWIMYAKNISADMILSDKPPFAKVPHLPIRISLHDKGLVPLAIKPLLDKRMEYKANPTALNRSRAAGLKQVLVTSYGYLRFREFKLGIATAHMAICSYAREMIIQAAHIAEQHGFEVVHGIVDSLYIKKKDIKEEEVKALCRELEDSCGIPISSEGIFNWIVFLPSVNDPQRPLPACYYGVFRSGDIKARGIEVRQRRTPLLIKHFQQQILEQMSRCSSKKEIKRLIPAFGKALRHTLNHLSKFNPEWLITKVTISKEDYTHNIPQKRIVHALRRKGIRPLPGQSISFIHQRGGKIVLPEDYKGKPDKAYYRKLLIRALYVVLQPFGVTKKEVTEMAGGEKQMTLLDYTPEKLVKHVYVPISRGYTTNVGLSERQFRIRLEKAGWEVWRGGSIAILRADEVYPNVRRKYTRLSFLMEKYHPGLFERLEYFCSVHHGMPDFLCFRNDQFKFVECKFKYEQLSRKQKKCIQKLQDFGIPVEVHILVDHPTKTRVAEINLHTGEKIVLAKQLMLSVP